MDSDEPICKAVQTMEALSSVILAAFAAVSALLPVAETHWGSVHSTHILSPVSDKLRAGPDDSRTMSSL